MNIFQKLWKVSGQTASGALDSASSGAAMSLGFMPVTGAEGKGLGNRGVYNAPGTELRSWGTQHFRAQNRGGALSTPMQMVSASELAAYRIGNEAGGPGVAGTLSRPKGWMPWVGSGFAAGVSAYFVYQGYQDNGFKGAFDMAVVDVAANTAVSRLVYNRAGGGTGALGGLTSMNKTWRWGDSRILVLV